MAPGPSCWPARRPTPTPQVSWTGWSRPIPRWCGCISTAPAPGESGATPRPRAATLTTIRRAAGAPGDPSTETDSRAEPAVLEPADHAIGRSRGGLTTKVHALTDGRGRALVVLLTAGNVNDTTMFAALLTALRVARAGPGRPRTCPDYLVADKGYSSRANRTLLRRQGIARTIPEPRDRRADRRRRGPAGGLPVGFDAARYARRNVVERSSVRSNSGADWPLATRSTPATTPVRSSSPPY